MKTATDILDAPRTDAPVTGAHRVPPVTDVHQHLWPEALLTALARRRVAPRLVRSDAGWELQAWGEPPCVIDSRDHDPARRAQRARQDGLERVVIAPSCPIGIESLAPCEADPLLDAYHDGLTGLGAPFTAWAAARLTAPDPQALEDRLAAGFVGLCVPAGAFAAPDDWRRIAPLLDVLAARSAPLFVHPGPSPWAPNPPAPPGGPAWWPALTTYVAQMQTAWFAIHHGARRAYPELRIGFAMLAGLAPLHHDRFRGRGGDGVGADPATFVETSSYGPDIAASVAAVIGADALVYGSDRPVVTPTLRDGLPAGSASSAPARFINGKDWQ